MTNRPDDPTRARRAWAGLALLVGAAGALLLAAAVTMGRDRALVLSLLGVAQLGVAGHFMWQWVRVNLRRPRLSPTPRALAFPEVLLLLAILPYCALFLWMGAAGYGAETRAITGRPVEVRSDSRTVYMPGGEAYTYVCWKDEGRGSGTCPAEARWAGLPRWPEPRHVDMLVAGGRIRGLTMDGAVIVEPSEFRGGDILDLALMLLAGAVGAVLAGLAIQKRLKRLKA